jgi:hypothetical protein
MVDDDETAERSSFRVGYRSASQFSRSTPGCSARRHDITHRRFDALGVAFMNCDSRADEQSPHLSSARCEARPQERI